MAENTGNGMPKVIKPKDIPAYIEATFGYTISLGTLYRWRRDVRPLALPATAEEVKHWFLEAIGQHRGVIVEK